MSRQLDFKGRALPYLPSIFPALARKRGPYCVGVAGPSGSGKTTLASALAKLLLELNPAVLATDSYYRDLSHLCVTERSAVNFDDPDQLDSALLSEHVRILKSGQPIREPVYDFATHTRMHDKFKQILAGGCLIVEGLFTLCWPDVRDQLDLKVFVSTPEEVCLQRRLERDCRERGRSAASVVAQFEATVRPGNRNFVDPSKIHADVIVSGQEGIDDSLQRVMNLIRRQHLDSLLAV